MIKNTFESPGKILSAYKDNASVIEGHTAERFYTNVDTAEYRFSEKIDILMKVETHNHPTAIAPYPGASTGSGGEIRDEEQLEEAQNLKQFGWFPRFEFKHRDTKCPGNARQKNQTELRLL